MTDRPLRGDAIAFPLNAQEVGEGAKVVKTVLAPETSAGAFHQVGLRYSLSFHIGFVQGRTRKPCNYSQS